MLIMLIFLFQLNNINCSNHLFCSFLFNIVQWPVKYQLLFWLLLQLYIVRQQLLLKTAAKIQI